MVFQAGEASLGLAILRADSSGRTRAQTRSPFQRPKFGVACHVRSSSSVLNLTRDVLGVTTKRSEWWSSGYYIGVTGGCTSRRNQPALNPLFTVPVAFLFFTVYHHVDILGLNELLFSFPPVLELQHIMPSNDHWAIFGLRPKISIGEQSMAESLTVEQTPHPHLKWPSVPSIKRHLFVAELWREVIICIDVACTQGHYAGPTLSALAVTRDMKDHKPSSVLG